MSEEVRQGLGQVLQACSQPYHFRHLLDNDLHLMSRPLALKVSQVYSTFLSNAKTNRNYFALL